MDSRKIKKLVLNNLAYVIFGYAGNIICFAFRTAEGKDVSEKILPALNNLGTAFAHIIPSFHPVDLLVGIAVGVVMKFVMKMRAQKEVPARHRVKLSITLDTLTARILKLSSDSQSGIEPTPFYSRGNPADCRADSAVTPVAHKISPDHRF